MTTRRMLELAALAAGIELRPFAIKPASPEEGDGFIGFMTKLDQWPRGWFNPLADDGDALRLAVKLQLSIHNEHTTAGCAYCMRDGQVFKKEWSLGKDEAFVIPGDFAATRLAIVRAAAAIGEEIEKGKI